MHQLTMWLRRLLEPALQKSHDERSEQGVALIAVLSALAVLTILAVNMQYGARVDAKLAYNGRDELIAYYQAKSALELELAMTRAVRQTQGMIQQLIPNAPIGNLLSTFPLQCEFLKQFISVGKEGAPMPVEGDCLAKAISEKGKIDLNMLGSISDKFRTRAILTGRLMDPRFERYFSEENSAGQRVTRDELVGFLTDYVDLDNVKDGSQGSDEDDVYARLKDSFKAKNAPFDSLDEVQLVYGINDDFFAAIKSGITIYPVGGINLGNADLVTIAAIIRQAAKDPADSKLYSEPMYQLLNQIKQARAMPMMQGALNGAVLVTMAQTLGITLDPQKIKDLVEDTVSFDWMTIEAEGQKGNVIKRLKATYNLVSNQIVYYREE